MASCSDVRLFDGLEDLRRLGEEVRLLVGRESRGRARIHGAGRPERHAPVRAPVRLHRREVAGRRAHPHPWSRRRHIAAREVAQVALVAAVVLRPVVDRRGDRAPAIDGPAPEPGRHAPHRGRLQVRDLVLQGGRGRREQAAHHRGHGRARDRRPVIGDVASRGGQGREVVELAREAAVPGHARHERLVQAEPHAADRARRDRWGVAGRLPDESQHQPEPGDGDVGIEGRRGRRPCGWSRLRRQRPRATARRSSGWPSRRRRPRAVGGGGSFGSSRSSSAVPSKAPRRWVGWSSRPWGWCVPRADGPARGSAVVHESGGKIEIHQWPGVPTGVEICSGSRAGARAPCGATATWTSASARS